MSRKIRRQLTAQARIHAFGIAALAFTTWLNPASQSVAQTADVSTGERIEAVTVTAEFRKENLQNTPLSISAIDSQTLDARGQTNIADIAAQAPNVSLRPAGAASGDALVAYIRGVGQGDFSFAMEPGVGTYIDDVYFATVSGAEFNLLDLDRVEILRGPQGTLAGKNSIGGAIKLYTKKPDGNGGGYVEGSFGSDTLVGGRGAADFTLVPDKLFARVSFAAKHQDGYVTMLDYKCAHPGPIDTGIPALGTIPDNLPTLVHTNSCELGKAGGVTYVGGRVAVRYQPNDRLTIDLTGDLEDNNSEVQAAVLVSAYYPNTIPAYKGVPFGPWFVTGQKFTTYANSTDFDNGYGSYTAPTDMKMRQWGTSANIVYNLTDKMQLTSISSYRQYSGQFGDIADGAPVSSIIQYHVNQHHQFTQELRLNDTVFDGLLDYTVGGFYYSGFSRDSARVDISYSPLPPTACPNAPCNLDFLTGDPVPAESLAGFVNAALHPLEKLTIDGGVRWSRDTKSYTFTRLAPDHSGPAAAVGGLNGVAGHFKHERLDYRVAVQYDWTSDLMTYASVSTGFKGGGINPRPFVPSQVVPFSPETLTAYEIGAKSEFWDQRLRLNAATFFNQYNNIQLTVFSCPQYSPSPNFPCFAPLNGGDAEVKGAELEAIALPISGLQIDSSLSYLHFGYTTISSNVGIPGVRGVQKGMVPIYTPDWKASLGVQYAIGLGDELGILTPRLDFDYEGRVYGNPVNAPTNRIAPYLTANGRFTYITPDDKWELALEVTNLTDKYYPLTIDDSHASTYYVSIQPARPREWTLSLRRNF